ncbi:MAG: BrnT family toxin [bacterium]
MIDLTKLEEFDWDTGNIHKNWIKHGVDNKECEEIFNNEPLLILPDNIHSQVEERYHALGKTNNGRLLFAAFTFRNNKVRIISARKMSNKEKKIYEQK